MSFRRSAKRLSVLAKLRKVDLMVLTEGGVGIQEETDNKFFSDKEIINDRFFWRIVFSKHGFKNRIFYKAIGSKTRLKEYAEEISKENIKNLCVAIDSDLDKVNEETTDSIYVLYTYGYSWENDVFTRILLLEHLKDLLLEYVEQKEVVLEVDRLVLEFIESSRIIMSDEFKFRKFGVSFVTRLNSNRFVRLDKDGVKIDLVEVEKEVKLLKEKILTNDWNKIEVPLLATFDKFVYGKFQEHFFYLLTQYIEDKYLKVNGKRSKNYFRRELLNKFKESKEVDSFDYYASKIEALKKAIVESS